MNHSKSLARSNLLRVADLLAQMWGKPELSSLFVVRFHALLDEFEGDQSDADIEAACRIVGADLLEVSRNDLVDFQRQQLRQRRDWPSTFTVGSKGELWPWVRWGKTPQLERVDVRGESQVLDNIAELILGKHPSGKRFFVDHQGVCWKESDGGLTLAVRFRFNQ